MKLIYLLVALGCLALTAHLKAKGESLWIALPMAGAGILLCGCIRESRTL